ncbi:MAG: CBS domain-containing protein, partial [Melioribacteraceae bacterium]|nr:CBS domain-containing protein [Melioribacteraceae bacterium]
MSNTISYRIYDFLKEHPPFSFIKKDELLNIVKEITVIYSQNGDIIFHQDEQPPPYFYVVREGSVKLYNKYKSEKILVDICDEGDIFGIRPLISPNQVYTLSAIVDEESLIYKIPTAIFVKTMTFSREIQEFFNSSFTAGMRNPYSIYSKKKILNHKSNQYHEEEIIHDSQSITFSSDPITCPLSTTIREAAKIMRHRNVGSLITVDEFERPIGIITDRDLRNKVSTGDVGNDETIEKIMSSPVITASYNISEADLQILMIKNNIHHICITKDGSNHSKLIGIASEHDLLVSHANNPSVLIREIKRSVDSEELKKIKIKAEQLLEKYLNQELSIVFISRIISEINYAITVRAIEISLEKSDIDFSQFNTRWCWLSLGSQARGEQLLRSDQDSALIFEIFESSNVEFIRKNYVNLAKDVTKILNECG